MTKMSGESKNLVVEKLEKLRALLPEAFVADGKIDFDALKGALGEAVDSSKEHYRFTWNGKEEARAFALRPSMGTLRPCVGESSGKDGKEGVFDSDNLYIEGDNLEVLKLLQGGYYRSFKLIYIDPPYNTGKDFVYEDDFHDSVANYKAVTGQTNSEGRATHAHSETSGRFHTDWLNMIFPRLLLAHKLLKDDGVVFISIDDSEVNNLKFVANEVFGEPNFIAQIVVDATPKNDPYVVSTAHEYCLVYCKNLEEVKKANYGIKSPLYDAILRIYEEGSGNFEQIQNALKQFYAENELTDDNIANYKYADERGVFRTGPIDDPQGGGARDERMNPKTGRPCVTPNAGWRCNLTTWNEWLKDGLISFPESDDVLPSKKTYITADRLDVMRAYFKMQTRKDTDALKNLFGLDTTPFSNPKPVELIRTFIENCNDKEMSILDFFSGSGTTFHAALLQNAKDICNRKIVLVQLPEVIEERSGQSNKEKKITRAAIKFLTDHGLRKNICEIGKERIRRAGKKIKEENATTAPNLDIGFKVFKLDTSNIIPWNPNPEDLKASLLAAVNNAVEGRTADDILYEILLKCNLPLTLPIEKKAFGENTINVVGEGALMICLDKPIKAAVAEEMVRLRDEVFKPEVAMQVVFLDNGFTDKEKANAIAALVQAGVEEKSILSI